MTMLTTCRAVLAVGCLPLIASAMAAAPKTPAATGPAASGYLEARQREYTPQSCSHNGNTAICTFQLVNRGNAVTLHAWPGDVRTLQLVDSSHVPHSAGRAYFIDSSGSHQAQLLLQGGDQGTIAVEFPNVDSNSSTSEFHLGSQIVGGGSSTGASTAAAAPAAAATAASPTSQATTATAGAKTATSTTPAASATPSPAAAPMTASAACAANPKSGACRAEQQEERVCAKNASSAACKNATAHAQKMEAAAK